MTFIRAAAATGFVTVAMLGATAPANAAPDPMNVEDPFCWRHPNASICDDPGSSGWGPVPDIGPSSLPDDGGQMVPNVDGGLSLPGSPGAV